MTDVTASEPREYMTLTLPDVTNPDEVREFYTLLEENKHVRGMTTLTRYFTKYLRSATLAEKHLARVHKTCQVIAGVRTPAQRRYTKTKTLYSAAWTFFDKLSADQLRTQCTLFNIDYDAFEEYEDRINALVEKIVGGTKNGVDKED